MQEMLVAWIKLVAVEILKGLECRDFKSGGNHIFGYFMDFLKKNCEQLEGRNCYWDREYYRRSRFWGEDQEFVFRYLKLEI